MAAKRILIIDDDVDILEVLQLLFESSDFDTKTSPIAEDTYHLVDEFKPHAIILDVLLSGYDGRDICAQLKTGEKTKEIPIIMISAHPDAQISTLKAGADAFLAKPFDIYELLQKVDTLTS